MIALGHASLGGRWVTSLKHAVPKSTLCPVQSQLNGITDPNAAGGANTYFNQLSSATTSASGKSRSCPASTCSRPLRSALRRIRTPARNVYWTFVLESFIHSFITRLPTRRSGALQQTFYGSPPACPAMGFPLAL